MRALSAFLAFSAIAVGGCAAVSGLGDYKEGNGSVALESNVGTGLPDDGSDAADTVADGSTGTPGDPDVATVPDDASAPADPSEASTVYESGALPDIQYDAPPACGPSNCGGCCSNGVCVGGGSVATCGSAGRACEDCTGMGGACTNHACATATADAGPPKTCKASSCTGCIPFYQTGCCKSDQTCGCEVSFSNNCQ